MENKTARISIISLIAILIILISTTSALTFNLFNNNLNFSQNSYINSHTKAICDENNYCQDYHIFCKKESLIKMSPITGAAIQLPSTWQDERNQETIDKIC
jgi:hypothetical protein